MYDVYRSAGKGGAEQGVGGGAGCGVILRSCEQRCKNGAYLVRSASIATEERKLESPDECSGSCYPSTEYFEYNILRVALMTVESRHATVIGGQHFIRQKQRKQNR
jgi:hypothetical protein